MTAEPAATMDTEFPHLSPDVVDAWRSAPEHASVEVVDGALFPPPRANPLHANAVGALLGLLGRPFSRGRGGPGGWCVLMRPELHLGAMPDIVIPDVVAWRRERMPVIPDIAAITLAPDWVCEILSEGTEAHDRGRKMRVYRRAGVAHSWLVDPRIHLLEVYRLEGGRYTLVDTWEGDAKVRAEPFDAVELDLSLLWAR